MVARTELMLEVFRPVWSRRNNESPCLTSSFIIWLTLEERVTDRAEKPWEGEGKWIGMNMDVVNTTARTKGPHTTDLGLSGLEFCLDVSVGLNQSHDHL